jgi:hypothetical protein
MPFLIACTNKGCFKSQEPYLDQNNKVICSECENEIQNISSFAKAQMKSMGQILKSKPSAFSIVCKACKANEQPELNGDKAFCRKCKNQLNISSFFLNSLKENLKGK